MAMTGSWHALASLPRSPHPKCPVIVPTRNERDNIAPLLARLDVCCQGRAEVIFVDDSDDGTAAEILVRADACRDPVRLIHRVGHERAGGLGTAVVTGLRAARAPWAVVMDADLQHPPEVAADLVDVGRKLGVDVVVASRYGGPALPGACPAEPGMPCRLAHRERRRRCFRVACEASPTR